MAEANPERRSRMKTAVRYVAEPKHVREVSLLGTANFEFWRRRLAQESLVPIERNGRARILIMAAEMIYWGVRFTEVSFSVLVCRPENKNQREAAFLVHAFNSCRLFAFCERALFAAPYSHGDCRVLVSPSVSITVTLAGEKVLGADMQSGFPSSPRDPSRSGDDSWEGVVFLPANRRGRRAEGRVFFARVKGQTQTYSFVPSRDVVSITPSTETEIFQALLESQFAGEAWVVREDATHGKSRSYQRSEIFAERNPRQS